MSIRVFMILLGGCLWGCSQQVVTDACLVPSSCDAPTTELPEKDSEATDAGVDTGVDIGSEGLSDAADDTADDLALDLGSQDAVDGATDDPEDVPVESELNVFFTSPSQGNTVEAGVSFEVVLLASDLIYGPEALEIRISTEEEGQLALLTPDFAGWAQASIILEQPGWQVLRAVVKNPAGEEFEAKLDIGACTFGQPETFDAGLIDPQWQTFGDAYFDNEGWLEMTGNEQGRQGAIFNTGEKVNPGDIEVSFKIWTGGGINSGADGFAMSVINVATAWDLEQVIQNANSGGCLGYGVSGPCGPMQLDAFHIEFDTWENTGDPNQDPTTLNHIAVTLNGDPSNHHLWESQFMEDSQWHDILVKIDGQNVMVFFDGNLVIQGDLPAFQFHGGYLGFSGTTGWATNFHRFDDLWVKQSCDVP